MNLFASNLEAANLSLPDSMLARLRASGTLYAIMDAQIGSSLANVVVITRDQRLVYAVEIGVHPLAD